MFLRLLLCFILKMLENLKIKVIICRQPIFLVRTI